jgi:hypothetical protein
MDTKTLWLPETPVEPLFSWAANDAIVCEAHTGPSDWAYNRLPVAENREWRAFIAAEYGANVSPCELCR